MNREVGLVTPCEPRTAIPKLCSQPAGTAGATSGSWLQSALIPLERGLSMNGLTDLVGWRCRATVKSGLRSSTALPNACWHKGSKHKLFS